MIEALIIDEQGESLHPYSEYIKLKVVPRIGDEIIYRTNQDPIAGTVKKVEHNIYAGTGKHILFIEIETL